MWTVAAASIIGAILPAASSIVFVDAKFAAAPVQAGNVWPTAVDWSGMPEMWGPGIPRFNKFDR